MYASGHTGIQGDGAVQLARRVDSLEARNSLNQAAVGGRHGVSGRSAGTETGASMNWTAWVGDGVSAGANAAGVLVTVDVDVDVGATVGEG